MNACTRNGVLRNISTKDVAGNRNAGRRDRRHKAIAAARTNPQAIEIEQNRTVLTSPFIRSGAPKAKTAVSKVICVSIQPIDGGGSFDPPGKEAQGKTHDEVKPSDRQPNLDRLVGSGNDLLRRTG